MQKSMRVVLSLALMLFAIFMITGCGSSGGGGGGGGNDNSATVSVAGTWKGTVTASDGTKESLSLTINLNQDGNTISGNFSMPDSSCFPSGEFNGTIDGSSFELSGSAIGGGFSVSLSVSGDSMTGTYLAVGNGTYCDGTDTGTVTLSK